MEHFTDYHEAYNYAVEYARYSKKEVGIEKVKWFGKVGFVVQSLPKPENRYGHELRMEVVKPTDPHTKLGI